MAGRRVRVLKSLDPAVVLNLKGPKIAVREKVNSITGKGAVKEILCSLKFKYLQMVNSKSVQISVRFLIE